MDLTPYIQLVSNLTPTASLSIVLMILLASFVLMYAAIVPSRKEMEEKGEILEDPKDKKAITDRIYDGSLTPTLIAMSYKRPYLWFIDETEASPQAQNIRQKITDAQLYSVLNYRSFTVIKLVVGVGSLMLMGILLLLVDVLAPFFPIFLGNPEDAANLKIAIIVLAGLGSVFPSLWLSGQAKAVKMARSKDLPILQLFLILSLRTGRSIREILKTLGNLNTRYKTTFKTAFLIHMRSESEAFDYLKEEFRDTRFEHTIRALATMENYCREDTITLLENSLEDIVAENKEKQEKKNVVNLFLTQGALILPLVALGLLVLYPIISHVSGMIGGQVVL